MNHSTRRGIDRISFVAMFATVMLGCSGDPAPASGTGGSTGSASGGAGSEGTGGSSGSAGASGSRPDGGTGRSPTDAGLDGKADATSPVSDASTKGLDDCFAGRTRR